MILNNKKWIAKMVLGFIVGGLITAIILILDKENYHMYKTIFGSYYRLLILFIFGFFIGSVDGIVEKSFSRVFWTGIITGLALAINCYFAFGRSRLWGDAGIIIAPTIFALLGGFIAVGNGIGINLIRLYQKVPEITENEFLFNIGRRLIFGSLFGIIVFTTARHMPFVILTTGLTSMKQIIVPALIGSMTYLLDQYYSPYKLKEGIKC